MHKASELLFYRNENWYESRKAWDMSRNHQLTLIKVFSDLKDWFLKSRTLNIQVFVFVYRRISKTRIFENLGFLKSKWISKTRIFENLGFLKSKFSIFTMGEYRKDGFIKVGEKISAISETSAFSIWPVWGGGVRLRVHDVKRSRCWVFWVFFVY